jgi:hypothetical protein
MAITSQTGGVSGKSISKSKPHSNTADARNPAHEAKAISFIFIGALPIQQGEGKLYV